MVIDERGIAVLALLCVILAVLGLNLTQPKAVSSDRAVENFLAEVVARGGVVSDHDPLLDLWREELQVAVDQGLISSGGAWTAQVYLTDKGQAAMGFPFRRS